MEQDPQAIEEYKKTLLLNPGDEDAKFNLEFLKGNKKRKDRNEKTTQGPKNTRAQSEKPKNPEALSREDAERLLSAMREQERQQFQMQTPHKPLEEKSPRGKDW